MYGVVTSLDGVDVLIYKRETLEEIEGLVEKNPNATLIENCENEESLEEKVKKALAEVY